MAFLLHPLRHDTRTHPESRPNVLGDAKWFSPRLQATPNWRSVLRVPADRDQNQGILFRIARPISSMRAAELMVKEQPAHTRPVSIAARRPTMARMLDADASWEAAKRLRADMAASALPRNMTSIAQFRERALSGRADLDQSICHVVSPSICSAFRAPLGQDPAAGMLPA